MMPVETDDLFVRNLVKLRGELSAPGYWKSIAPNYVEQFLMGAVGMVMAPVVDIRIYAHVDGEWIEIPSEESHTTYGEHDQIMCKPEDLDHAVAAFEKRMSD